MMPISERSNPMSKKKDRAWFVCAQWPELTSPYYPDDAAAARALRADPRVLARVRQRTPVTKSTLLKLLRRLSRARQIKTAFDELITDTRSS
jgi:hypothetical protein